MRRYLELTCDPTPSVCVRLYLVGLVRSGWTSVSRLTQEVAELRVQSLQQDAELEQLLLHGLLRLFKVLVLQR